MTEQKSKTEPEKEPSFILYTLKTTVWLLAFIFMFGIVAASAGSALGYYRVETVLSGSMEPSYGAGDAVFATAKKKETIAVGDVLIFQSPDSYGGERVMHRVISARMTEAGDVFIRTKGDANDVADPWEAKVTTTSVWVAQKPIPYVGYIFHYSKKWWPLLIAIAVCIPLLSYANQRTREVYGKKPLAEPPAPTRENQDEAAPESNMTPVAVDSIPPVRQLERDGKPIEAQSTLPSPSPKPEELPLEQLVTKVPPAEGRTIKSNFSQQEEAPNE